VLLSPTLVASIPLAIWIYLFLARGNFWQPHEDDIYLQPLENWPRVVAIVPARNEAETIAQTVRSLAAQDYPGEFSIIIVDDHSEDATATLARKAANECGAAERVKIHTAAPLAPGWTGKLWALNEGVQIASQEKPDFLWFTDADIEHAQDTLHRLVYRAEKDALDLASLMVLLQAKTFPERLLIPPFLYFFLMLYPPRWIAKPNAITAGAAGGCILLRRNVLAPIRGIASIRGEVIDDCALARLVKKNGGRIWMGLTRRSVSLRSYWSFAELRNMIARTAFTQLHYSILLLVLALAGLFITFLLPWFSFLSGEDPAWFLASTAICLMTVTFGVTVRFYGLPWPWALTLPFATVFYGYATCLSAARYWLGRGAQWKGRSQAPHDS
jgi:hopene-associated glycosyltransferase HpnB